MSDAVATQGDYYQRNAGWYDDYHLAVDLEHEFALDFMLSTLERFSIRSILDLGSGTGRVPLAVKKRHPTVRVIGIEPSLALRERGYAKGLAPHELIDGEGTKLPFTDGTFDLVCEYGALHHIKDHRAAVSEMMRVAKKAIFISDNNTFGWGSPRSTLVKRAARRFGLWKLAEYVATRGRGYMETKDDGIWYLYSAFDSFQQIRPHCKMVHVLNIKDTSGADLYKGTSHVAILGLKAD